MVTATTTRAVSSKGADPLEPRRRPEIFFSFFMFTADLQPNNPAYTEVIARHIRELSSYGYDGFDLPIAPTSADQSPFASRPGDPGASGPPTSAPGDTVDWSSSDFSSGWGDDDSGRSP